MTTRRLVPIGPIQRGYDDNTYVGLFDRQGKAVVNLIAAGSFALAQASDISTIDLVASNALLAADIAAAGSTDVLSGDPTGAVDITTAFNAAVGPGGTFVLAGKTNARFEQGTFKAGLLFPHPSISLEMHSRGGTLVVPQDNLTSTSPSGGQSAVITIPRLTPASGSNLAWAPSLGGFNIDFRGTTQNGTPHAIFVPNPNPANNSHDPDPNYSGNKDYVAGRYALMDIVGGPGSGIVISAGNGRADFHSFRALNFAGVGIDLGGNDVVMSGHWAVGGNGLFGLKVGLAAGFFGGTGNLWGTSSQRSLTCGAAWFNQRKMFSLFSSEFNDWLRMDGGSAYWRGGNISNNVFAQFGANFVSDGVAIDLTPNDSRLQANVGTIEYQSLNFYGNNHLRTDSVGDSAAFTVTIGAGAVFTSNKHGLTNGTPIVLLTSGALPTGLSPMTWYYVVGSTTNTFQLALTVGGSAITTSGTQSGTHIWGDTITPSNVGGDLVGNFGTAPAYAHDIGGSGNQPAMINIGEGFCSAPNVKGWAGPSTTFTVTIASPGVFTTPVAHNLQIGYRVSFGSTGALPTGLAMGTQYWIVAASSNTFAVSATQGGAAINTTGTQSGTHRVYNLSSRPFNTHNGAQLNYWLQDAYTSLFMVGAQGPVHSQIALGIAEIDEPRYGVYAVEAGDRTQPSGVFYRNALYGLWELHKTEGYQDTAWDRRSIAFNSPTVTTFSRDIQVGQRLQLISLSGGAFTSGAVTLPTDLNASQFLDLVIWGQNVTAFTVGVTGSGSINTNIIQIPTAITQYLAIRFYYERDTNRWDPITISTPPLPDVSAKIGSGVPVSLTSATVANLVSITLGQGQWDVTGVVVFTSTAATTTPSLVRLGISIVSATALPATDATAYASRGVNLGAVASGTDFDQLQVGVNRINVAPGTTQQVWLNCRSNFTGTSATMTAFGAIRAVPAAG